MTRVLVTSARFPFSLDEIRKFGHFGHDVYATDTFRNSPGQHSKYVREALHTPSPRYESEAFRASIRTAIDTHEIELLVPTFEEVFYLTKHMDEFSGRTHVFAPTFETSALLHDKARFIALARELGLAVPRTVVVESQQALVEAIAEIGQFFARAAFSRGGVSLLTNAGPLAGVMAVEDCVPTPTNPWLVQDYVEGTDLCSFSVVHHGKVAAHSTYLHPRTMEHAGGIVFESIVDPETLAVAQTIAEATGYHGQVSFDFMRTTDGTLQVVECNTRPTAGVIVMPDDMFVGAVLDPDLSGPAVAPAGARYKISVALIRDMVRDWREIPADISALLAHAKHVYADPEDVMPALYQFLSYSHVVAYRKQMHMAHNARTDVMEAYFYDVCWDGEPID